MRNRTGPAGYNGDLSVVRGAGVFSVRSSIIDSAREGLSSEVDQVGNSSIGCHAKRVRRCNLPGMGITIFLQFYYTWTATIV